MKVAHRPVSTHRNIGRFLIDSSPTLWLVVETLLAWALFYIFASFGKGSEFPEAQLQNQKGAFLFAMAFGIVGVGLGLFERENRFNRLKALQLISLSTLIAAVTGLFILYLTSYAIVGRWSLLLGSLGASTFIYLFVHSTGASLLVYFPHRFLVVGTPSLVGKKILDHVHPQNYIQFQHASEAYEYLQKQFNAGNPDINSLVSYVRNDGISELVISWDGKNTPEQTEFLFAALKQGLRIVDDVKYYSFITRRIPIEDVPTPFILKMGFDIHRPLSGLAKRLFDIFLAIFLLLALAPFFLLTAIAIALESGFPIIYTQKRYGRFGKIFNVYKFRSMRKDQEGPKFTRPNDNRITFVGKFIRQTHIDEFPQLINILGGSMSFVGPRPEAAEIVEERSKSMPLMHLRHIVRPGLTGHAQINQGKTEDSIEDLRTKLSFDLYYIKNFSFFLDLSILTKTFSRLLKSTW